MIELYVQLEMVTQILFEFCLARLESLLYNILWWKYN